MSRRSCWHRPASVLSAALLLAVSLVTPSSVAATTQLLPCPIPQRWQLVRQILLPWRGPDSHPIGGFSAIRYQADGQRIWLLSDLPQGSISTWADLQGQGPLRLERTLMLRPGPGGNVGELDGEGLVLFPRNQAWVAGEGRRSVERPAQLLRFDLGTGALLQTVSLPPAWQPGPGQGLTSNGGPESLIALPMPDGSPALLMAAERPLMQDPKGRVRLLRWRWSRDQDPLKEAPRPEPLGSLPLPAGEDWGLTDLLAVGDAQLLALMRRFIPPAGWQIRLELHALPQANTADAPKSLASWDLIAAGLEPDNWEGLELGPALPDGRSTLLLVSDDNLNPLQRSRVALLAADPHSCPPRR